MEQSADVIEAVRRALGRVTPLDAAPVPPAIDEPITRLVHSEVGLPELFAGIARANKIGVTMLGPDELPAALIEFLRSQKVNSIALAVSPLLKQLDVMQTLLAAGFDARSWESMTLDQTYDIDCGITDVYAAVAEVGGLVIRGSAGHGRSISLMPQLHIAILEPKNFLPDLVDLFERLPKEGNEKFVIITGPSKTADIEMNLVTGVHGPGIVQAFILQ